MSSGAEGWRLSGLAFTTITLLAKEKHMRKGSYWLSDSKKRSGLYLLVGLMAIGLLIGGSVVWAQSNGNGITGPATMDNGLVSRVAVPTDAKWQEFRFNATGQFAVACAGSCVPSSAGNSETPGSPPWTFTLGASGGTLTVTDAFNIGDRFEVFDNNVSLGLTSVPGTSGSCGDDPEVCVTNSAVSHATFNLGSGAHSITIKANISVGGQGAAYFLPKNGSSSCPAIVAASIVPDGSNILNSLYRLRDEVMLQNGVGQRYVQLYYTHSNEASQVLMKNWWLNFRVATLLWRHQSTVNAVINHQPATIGSYDANEIDAIIGAFMQGASPGLSADLAALRQAVRNRTVFADFGVRLN
jgi:hypothetical protein